MNKPRENVAMPDMAAVAVTRSRLIAVVINVSGGNTRLISYKIWPTHQLGKSGNPDPSSRMDHLLSACMGMFLHCLQ